VVRHGGVVAALFIAVLPYAFDQVRPSAISGAGDVGRLFGGLVAARRTIPRLTGLDSIAYFETVLFIVVAMALKRIPATLIARIRSARSVMGEASRVLAVRASAAESDELGFLEKSLNRMLEEIGATISGVQREADEVAAFAEHWQPRHSSFTPPPSR